ncbi:hypothetical protein J3R83DRAFT_7877 [Lanmaoa asiatica]|nr:hypothetical protein J3R83DRAFT_7877 [Lanmaoa asiatica]
MGMNCILFFFCVYLLWGQKSKSRKFLLLSSIVQFSLALAQTALYIAYLITAFTLFPGGAESYFQRISGYSLACYIIYTINFIVEGLLLLWRIYIVYGNNIKICIPLIILLLLQVALGGATAKGFAEETIITGRLHAFNLVTWALIATVNVSATILICLRLWVAHQKAHAILSQSKYKSSIIIVVECGALVTACTVAMLILYAVKHPMGIAGLGISTQVATLAPLLIIARYGILSRQDDLRSLSSQMPLRISVVRTQDIRVETLIEPIRKKPLVSDHLPDVPDGNKPRPFGDTGG